jgi:hypothetical protein
MTDPERPEDEVADSPEAAPAEGATPRPEAAEAEESADRRKSPRGSRPSLEEERDPVVRDQSGYRLRLEPRDLVRLRELPGSKGKTDRELGELFFDGQAERLAGAVAGDVETPAEIRVVVDPYSRQAFLAVGRTIRGIVSF